MKKILLYIPSYEGKLTIDMVNFLETLQVPEGYELHKTVSKRTMIDIARNSAVQKTIDEGYDYLFFVDDDTIPEKDILVKLVSYNLPIVTGVYRARGGDKKLLIYNKKNIDDIPYYYNINKINIANGTIQRVEGCGAGCLLISRDLLVEMTNEYGKYLFDFGVTEFEGGSIYLSEDLAFCNRVTSMGYFIYVDTSSRCKHLGDTGYVCKDESLICKNSDPEICIILKESNIDKMQKHIIDNIKSNYKIAFMGDEITEEIITSAEAEYIMYVDNIEMPYGLDELMIHGLSESIITGPLTIIGKTANFRNDNIVTHCWMMRKEDLLQIVPVPTKLEDFTIYRKIKELTKEDSRKCGILNATVKLNVG